MSERAGRSSSRAAAQTRHVRSQMLRLRSRGVAMAFHEDLYPFILRLTWPRFFGLFALVFVAINLLFAALYVAVPGSVTGADGFLDHFFFSVETFATIGYGEMTPNGRWAHAIMSVEALVNMGSTAVMTGLAFARFARPTARILFSDRMVIGPWDGVPHLMFRMANQRQNQLTEATVSVMVLLHEKTREGQTLRRPHDLTLVRNKNPLFALTWLAMHRIDEKSPFHGPDALEKLKAINAEVYVSLTGLDETLMQTVTARFRYPIDDIVPDAHFADVLTVEEDGTRVIDYAKFHDIVPNDPEKA